MTWTAQNIFEASGCLSKEAFMAFLNGELPPEAHAAALSHIDGCPFCSDALEGFEIVPDQNKREALLAKVDQSFHHLEGVTSKKSSKRRYLWIPVSAAAGLLLLFGLFNLLIKPENKKQLAEQSAVKPIRHDEVVSEEASSLKKTEKPEKQPKEQPAKPKKPTEKFTTTEVVADNEVKKEKAIAKSSEDANAVDVAELKVRSVVQEKEEIFQQVEQMPDYPGGTDALSKFLSENIKYPKTAAEMGISGRVYVKFVVNKQGEISNVSVLRGIGGGCDEEAVRVVKMMPNWKPGKQNGMPVNTYFTLPIVFRLSEPK
ncbi:MAG: TonB family protein [Bacteroidota bacterium]|nr:TonB family protein [Bacteroidota bacterium]